MSHGYLSWKAWSVRPFGRYPIGLGRYFELEFRRSGLPTLQGLKVGELGFGNGEFAAWVHDQGGHWVGQEKIVQLMDRATEAGFKIVVPPATFSDFAGPEHFDAIVAFDVLEHLKLQEIRTFLADARRALKPGGLFLARFPSGDSPFVGAIYFGDITHCTLLGSSAVSQLALESGFEVNQRRPPVVPLTGLGLITALRRSLIYGLQSLLFWSVSNLIMGNAAAVTSPNMWIVLKKTGRSPEDVASVK